VTQSTGELVPVANIAALDQLAPQDREIAVTKMLGEARSWLAHAMEATQPQTVSEFRAWVATVAETTRQLNLSKEIQLDALEMVRRAERGVGVAIRAGQERGEIRSLDDARQHGVNSRDLVAADNKVSPADAAGLDQSVLSDYYDLTDEISDEQFDSAVTEAKDDGNLSRANVVRKLKGEPAKSKSQRHQLLRGTRRIDPDRVINATVMDASNIVIDSLLDEVDFAALDRSKLNEWASSLGESINALRRLKTRLERELTHD